MIERTIVCSESLCKAYMWHLLIYEGTSCLIKSGLSLLLAASWHPFNKSNGLRLKTSQAFCPCCFHRFYVTEKWNSSPSMHAWLRLDESCLGYRGLWEWCHRLSSWTSSRTAVLDSGPVPKECAWRPQVQGTVWILVRLWWLKYPGSWLSDWISLISY